MTKRITFPKVSGTNTWRNAETGVTIERNFANGSYEIFYTSHNDEVGYWGTEYSLKGARELAAERVETVREQLAEAHADALLIEGEMISHGLDVTETAAHAATAPRPLRFLWEAAAHSLEAGFLDAAAERLRKVVGIIDGTTTVPTNEQADAALAAATNVLGVGVAVHSDIDGPATVDRVPFIEAETGRVLVGLRLPKGWATRYVDDVQVDADGNVTIERLRKAAAEQLAS